MMRREHAALRPQWQTRGGECGKTIEASRHPVVSSNVLEVEYGYRVSSDAGLVLKNAPRCPRALSAAPHAE